MWLVSHNRCWTADRLDRKALPHPKHCFFCDEEEECCCNVFFHDSYGLVSYKGSVCSPSLQAFNRFDRTGPPVSGGPKFSRYNLLGLLELGNWPMFPGCRGSICLFRSRSATTTSRLLLQLAHHTIRASRRCLRSAGCRTSARRHTISTT